MAIKWTQECDYILCKNWNIKTQREIAKMLGCDDGTVTKHAQKLRALGVDLPDKRFPTMPATAPVPQKIVHAPSEEKKQSSYWPDGWRIEPPTPARLMSRR